MLLYAIVKTSDIIQRPLEALTENFKVDQLGVYCNCPVEQRDGNEDRKLVGTWKILGN